MAFRIYRITLTDPNGTEHDLVEDFGVELDSVGRITEELGDDLTTLMHPDLDLTIFDDRGDLATLLRTAQRGQIWRVLIERQPAPGDPWVIDFRGVLDVPMSIRISPREREVSITVFAESKLLELYNGEDVRRTFAAQTGTISSGSTTLTLTPGSSELRRGDRLKIDNGSTSEELDIDAVSSPTSFQTTTAASTTYTAAPVSILTPYYRSKTVDQMVALILAGTELSERRVDIAQELQSIPFPSDLNTTGLPTAAPYSILERAGKISVYVNSNRYDATTPSEPFANAGADSIKTDWRPYKTTEPGTLRALPVGTPDDGTGRVYDYDTGDYYTVTVAGDQDLQLHKNGAFLVTVAAGGTGGGTFAYEWTWWHEFHEGLGEVWIAYHRVRENTISGAITSSQATVRFSTAGAALGTVTAAAAGPLRYSAALARMLMSPHQISISGVTIEAGDPIHLYNGATFDRFLDGKTDLHLWTLRAMGNHVLCVRDDGSTSSVVVWDTASGDIVAEHVISVVSGTRRLGTVWDAGGTATPYYVGYAGGRYFVVSTALSGVVPYADFDGMSRAAALRELALFSGGVFYVDEHGIVTIVGRRSSTITSQDPIELSEPIGSPVEMPVSEWYKRSVQVTGKDERGNDIEVIAGSRGDSSARLELEMQIPVTSGYAAAIGAAFYNHLVALGRQIDARHLLPEGERVRATSRVTVDGTTYQVFRVETDANEETAEVQYVEVIS